MSLVNRFVAGCRQHSNWVALGCFIGFVGLANWQLLLHLPTHVVGRPFEDAFGILWDLDWAQRAIFDLHASPFYTPDVFYPYGFYISSSSPPMWWFVVLSPLTRLVGSVPTYNLIMLGSYVVAGLGMYSLIVYLGQRRLAGILGGCVYVAAPILAVRFGGHTDILFSSMWLPYLALFSQRALQERQRRGWLLAGLFLALSCLGHWQFAFFAPLLPLIIIGTGRADIGWRERARLIAVVGITGAAIAAPFAAVSIFARSQMYVESPSFPIAVADNASLSLDRLFVPNPLSSIWGKWSQTVFPLRGEMDAVSVSYATLIVAVIGFFSKWPQRRAYGVLLGITIVLALGITLHWNARPVVLTLPPSLASLFRPAIQSVVGPDLMPPGEAIVVPLPMAFLYRLFPFLSITRIWARYMILGMLAIGVLVGVGAGRLAQRFPKHGYAIFAILIGLVFVEGLITPYSAFTEVSANTRPIDRWLTAQTSQVSLIEYPLPVANKLAMYRQLLHRQQVVNGYASIEPSHLQQAAPILGTWPTLVGLELLRKWRVDYVLVNGTNDEKFVAEILTGIRALDGLCLERDDNEPDRNRHTYLFRILANGQVCNTGQ
jgi:hypothetical protein